MDVEDGANQKMTEVQWVKGLLEPLKQALAQHMPDIYVSDQQRLCYAHEIRSYFDGDDKRGPETNTKEYATDLLVYERFGTDEWRPRVVIEAKLHTVTTHDAITYSQKAHTHKSVHPYLRYGILLGGFGGGLPGRLYRHGAFFDFMMAIHGTKLTTAEMARLVDVVVDEVRASRDLEAIIFDSRARERPRFTFLHRKLELQSGD